MREKTGSMKKTDKIDRRHLRSIQTRAKLLEAGRTVFLENGFQQATISQIIKRASVGYGTAYVHFEGKDDILVVLMEDVMAAFYRVAEAPFNPSTRDEATRIIERQATEFLKLAEKERHMLRVFEQAIGISDAARRTWQMIRERFIESIAKDIRSAQQAGLARELNPDIVARGWFFANEMYLFEIVREEQTESVETIARTLTAIYTGGLYPR